VATCAAGRSATGMVRKYRNAELRMSARGQIDSLIGRRGRGLRDLCETKAEWCGRGEAVEARRALGDPWLCTTCGARTDATCSRPQLNCSSLASKVRR
jgi:hypothetical protein